MTEYVSRMTCRVGILRGWSILDASGWNFFANFSYSAVNVILTFLAGASVPADEAPVLSAVPDCSPTISKSSSESSSSSSLSRSLSFFAPDSHSDSSTPTECDVDVTTFNDSELSSADVGVLGNMFSARSRTVSHQRSNFLTCKGFSPREANLLKSSWTQPVLLQHRQPTVFLFLHSWTQNEFEKKIEGLKGPGTGRDPGLAEVSFFLPLSVPGPLRPSTVFKTLNRLCSHNSAFQVDRGVSEGFSVELGRDRTWWGKGTSIVQD